MATRLTQKQKAFATEYLESGNATQAALKAYDTDSPNTAKAIGSENLTKPNVIAYLESKAERVSEIIFDIAEHGENDNVRLGASKDILDRAGYKAVEKTLNVNVDITGNPTDAKLFDEYKRQQLNTPRTT